MVKRLRGAAAAIAAIGAAWGFAAPAMAQGGVTAGTLTCNVASGWGFVFGSSRLLNCTYHDASGRNDHYVGKISKFGADIGYQQGGVLIWGVIAPTAQVGPGALSGGYGGATASATVGVGVGANALIGGSNRSISLQPLSVEGNQGLNVAAGIAAMSLEYRRG
jgi:hypothetical protein